jgi:tetrahydromethanopterin S-methyltransferase subunit H
MKQRIIEIGNLKIGGQPGETSTVLIGSIFYHRQKIVLDENTGRIDRINAQKLIRLQEEFSEKTGNPSMLDVVGSTREAIENYIDFVAEVTELPILVDSPSVEVRIAGLKFAKSIGLENRTIYNSLTPESKPEELEAIKESGMKSAILLAYKEGVTTSRARTEALKELLPRAEKVGITKPLLDTAVIDIPSLSMACRAILQLKKELGLPCGCGAHNAMSTWTGFKERMGSEAVKPCAVAVNAVPVVLAADFILYGPIEDCRYVFPSIYAINASYKYLYRSKEQIEF